MASSDSSVVNFDQESGNENASISLYDINTNSMFRVVKCIGAGSYGKVFQMRDRYSNLRAVKVISFKSLKNLSAVRMAVDEVTIMRRLSHENVVKFIQHYKDHLRSMIVMEFCCNKTLQSVIDVRGSLSNLESRYFIKQIMRGLDYLHANRVIHRDIKPENVLLANNLTVKIADFGLAALLAPGESHRILFVGTPDFIAPEIIQKKGHDFACDIWSAACLLLNLLTGMSPFNDINSKQIFKKILRLDYRLPTDITTYGKDFVKACLTISPKERATARQLLNHDYLTRLTVPNRLPTSVLKYNMRAAPRMRKFLGNP